VGPELLRPLPDDLARELSDILGRPVETQWFDEKSWGSFEYELSCALAQYRMGKKAYRGEQRIPTAKEVESAAESLRKDIERLLPKLDTDMGGLIRRLPSEVLWRGGSPPPGAVTAFQDDLRRMLTNLHEACSVVLSDTVSIAAPSNPKRELTLKVAQLFRDLLHEEPTGTCPSPEQGYQGGRYYRVLSACFRHVDGFEPGDLPKLAKAGVK
jgi:hypothetical protein